MTNPKSTVRSFGSFITALAGQALVIPQKDRASRWMRCAYLIHPTKQHKIAFVGRIHRVRCGSLGMDSGKRQAGLKRRQDQSRIDRGKRVYQHHANAAIHLGCTATLRARFFRPPSGTYGRFSPRQNQLHNFRNKARPMFHEMAHRHMKAPLQS